MASKKNLCILRVQPLATKGSKSGSLSSAMYHLDYHEKTAEISRPENENFSRHLCREKFPDYKTAKELVNKAREKHNEAVDKYNEGNPAKKKRHLKESQSQCFEVVMSFSPDMENDINVKEWAEAQLKWLQSEYLSKGCKLLRLDVHCDEATTHAHAIILCWDKDKEISSTSQTLGNKYDLSKLQTRYAEEMERFGLARGHKYLEEYERVRNPAFREAGITGKPSKAEERRIVSAYCKKHDIPMPQRNYHETLRSFKTKKQKVLAEYERLCNDIKALDEIERSLSRPADAKAIFDRLSSAENLIKTAKKMTVWVGDPPNERQKSVFDWLRQEYEKQEEMSIADKILSDNYYGLKDDDILSFDNAPDWEDVPLDYEDEER